MSVTLDVSKLSEWLLNAAAPCDIEKGAREKGRQLMISGRSAFKEGGKGQDVN